MGYIFTAVIMFTGLIVVYTVFELMPKRWYEAMERWFEGE